MYLENFTYLAAETPRSLIYLEKFIDNNIELGSVVIVENPVKNINMRVLNKKIGVMQKYLGLAQQKSLTKTYFLYLRKSQMK